MATSKVVGLTIEIEAKSSKLTTSLNDAQKSLNKTTAAIKDVDKALETVTDESQRLELMAQRQELVKKQIEETKDKLEIMRKVAEDAAEGLKQGTVTKEQYAQLTAELYKTEQGLKDLENQANETGEEMGEVIPESAPEETQNFAEQTKKAGISMDDLKTAAVAAGPAIGTALAIVGTGISILGDFVDAAVEAGEAIASFMVDRVEDLGIALEDTLETLKEFTIGGSDYADRINTLSKTTGLSTERLQELDYMSKLVDVDVSTIAGSMTKLEKAMASANGGSKSMIETFDSLGIEYQDANGDLLDLETVYWNVIDAAGQMSNEVDRDTTLMTLLGKSAKDLLPLIQAGSDGIYKYTLEARTMGYVLSDESLNAFQTFDDNLERLDKGVQAAKNGLGLILLPLLTDLSTDGVDMLGEFNRGVMAANGDITKIGQVINTSLPKVLNSIITHLPDAVSIVNDLISTTLDVILQNAPLILDSLFSVVTTIADSLFSDENIDQFFNAIVIILGYIQDFIITRGPTLIEIGARILVAIIEGIAQTIPVLVPTMVNAVTTIIGVLTRPDVLNNLIGAAVELLSAFTTATIEAIPVIEPALTDLIDALCVFITTLGPLITDAGIKIFEAILNSGAIEDILDAIGPDIVKLIVDIGVALWKEGPYIGSMFIKIFTDLAGDAFTWGQDIIRELVGGLTSTTVMDLLTTGLATAAAKVNSYLHFSTPDEGPLAYWRYDNPGAGMVDYIVEGMDQELPELETSLDLMAGTIAGNAAPDYSGQLDGINGSLTAIAGADRQIVIPVYIGQERIETLVAAANMANNYQTGGR